MYLKKYINFNIFKFNFSISQHVVCLHLFDLFTYLISLHWKIESEIAWLYTIKIYIYIIYVTGRNLRITH